MGGFLRQYLVKRKREKEWDETLAYLVCIFNRSFKILFRCKLIYI